MKEDYDDRTENIWPYQGIVENSPDGVVLIRAHDKVIVYANPAMEAIFGYAVENWNGKPLDAFLSPVAQRWQEISQVLQECGSWQAELEGLKRDRTSTWFRTTILRIFHPKLRELWVSFYQDISKYKQLEKELEQVRERYCHSLDNMLEGCQIIDFDWRYVYVNDSVARQGRSTREALLHHTMMEMYPGIESTEVFAAMKDCMENRIIHQMENKFIYPNGEEGWFELSIQPVPEGIFILSMDITKRKKAEKALRQSEERFTSVFLEGPVGISISVLTNGKIIDANESFLHIFGYSREEVIGRTTIELNIITPESRANIMRQLREQGRLRNFEIRSQTKAGAAIYGLLSMEQIELEGETYIITTMIDITARKQAEEQIKNHNEKLELLFEVLPVGVSVLNKEHKVVKQNAALEQILGISRKGVTRGEYRKRRYLRPDGTTMPENEFASARVFNGEPTALNVETGIVKEDGTVVWTNVSAIAGPFTDWSTIIVTSDITGRRLVEEELQRANAMLQAQLAEIQSLQSTLREQAVRDALTGLFNRRYLNETIDRELARAKRENYSVSVMMLDIDHFKEFNDRYGHKIGDEVLMRLGKLLHECIRHEDIACRYGGDEFVLILPGASADDARHRAEEILTKFGNTRMDIGTQQLSANISMGIAIYPQHGQDGNEIFHVVDAALYHAKKEGRNRLYVWGTD